MKLIFSLMVLYLKGLFVQTETVFFPSGSVCAPAGSDVAVGVNCFLYSGWIFQAWKLRINNTETLVDPQKDSRYKYFQGLFNTCYLKIDDLKETDAGTYYMSFIHRRGITSSTSKSQSEVIVHVTDLQVTVDSDHVAEGQNVTLTCKTNCPLIQTFIWFKNGLRLDLQNAGDLLHVSGEDSDRYSCALKRFERFPSAETLLNVSNVAYESIMLCWFLIPVVLLLVCAALWMIRAKQQNLKRCEGKEQSKQNENESTLPVTFDLEEKVKSVPQEEEVQYSCVHFSKFTDTEYSSTSEKEAEVQYAQISLQHHED